MPAASMKQLLESGVHFGHQTRRWNPKMKPFIFSERGGIHIIDLQQTTVLLDRAYEFVVNIVGRGGSVLFVGTKKQCQDAIAEEATRVGMPYVSHRWLGGLLTNFATIDNRIKRMHELRKLKEEGQLGLLPTKERMTMERELEKLEVNLGGVSNMSRLPDAVFIVDQKREVIATKEVNKLGLPLIGLCDTNCDPDEVEYIIPGNDDAIRSCNLIVKTLVKAVEDGQAKIQVSEFQNREEQPKAGPTKTRAAGGSGDGADTGESARRSPARRATTAVPKTDVAKTEVKTEAKADVKTETKAEDKAQDGKADAMKADATKADATKAENAPAAAETEVGAAKADDSQEGSEGQQKS